MEWLYSLFASGVPVGALVFGWSLALIVSLFVLIRGADMFVVGAKQMGSSLGMSKFAIGVIIVGFGTSFPELAASIAAVVDGATEIVLANAVGSNITNILLVVGLAATLGGRIIIKRDLIKTELPIFFIATTHFLAVIFDGKIDRIEALLLLGTFCAYLWYLFVEAREVDDITLTTDGRRPRLDAKSVVFIVFGLVAVLIGAKFTVDMVVNIASILAVPVGLISITAIALGTSLPELFVSLQAVKKGEGELAIGNIFGSNAFNILLVVGIPGVMMPLVAGDVVMQLGVPILLAASAIFFVNGLAKQVMRWEGMMLLLFFAFFLIKLTAFI
ncbi:calcium/sodium antiporter [Candidatus Kaiserbacteria bacterium]|nr:calcium/sodium antiporter [Candidatus Kaiserbacteria bacterium]